MKKIIFIVALLGIIHTSGRTQNITDKFILTGKIEGQNTGKVFLYYTDKHGKRIKDSSALQNGAFQFKGDIVEPTESYFEGNVKSRDMGDPNATSFFLEPGQISATLRANDFKHAKITGSKAQDEAAELEKSKESIYKEMEPLDSAYEKAGEEYRKAVKNKIAETILDSMKEKLAAMHDQFDPFQQQVAKINYSFFASHPNSYVTASNLRFYVSSLPLDSLEMFYKNMNTKLQQSSYGKNIREEIEKLRNGSPGALAKNFSTNDINGNKLSLSDFKNKYVLIDFWASWCVPCRHSNPHLIELYQKYHDKNFDIIGVSDDDNNHDAWKKAVAKDNIGIWHHVLRGLDWDKINKGEKNENDISEKFGIHSLPTKILIDKNGVIIGRYDKGTDEEKEAMDKMIANVLN